MTLITSATKAGADQITAANNNAQRLDDLQMAGDYATSTGSSNAYVLALDAAIVAYTTGATYKFKANFANTGAATININSLGAKTIKTRDGNDIIPGHIPNGAITIVLYDGTNMQLVSASSSAQTIDAPFTAYEALSAGDRVSIGPTAGYVEKTIKHNFYNPGAAQGIAGSLSYTSSCKVTVDSFAKLYNDGTNWKLIIGEVNRETLVITHGTAVTVNAASTALANIDAKVIYMSDGKIACLYYTADNHLRMRIYTVSGNTPSPGTEADLFTVPTTPYGCSMCLIDTDILAVAMTYLSGATRTFDTFGCSAIGTTTITNDIANKRGDNSGVAGGRTYQADIIKVKSGTTLSFTSHTTGDSGLVGTLNCTKCTWIGTVPTYVSHFAPDNAGLVSYISSQLTCSNSGNEKVLLTWYDSGPAYNACVVDVVAMTAGTILDLTKKPYSSAYSSTYFSLATIEVDTTSNNESRSIHYASGGVVLELTTSSTTVYLVTELEVVGSGNYESICLIDSSRKKIVLTYGTGIASVAMAEYDNTNFYVGCVRAAAAASATVAIVEKGNLDQFSGLTAKTSYHFQPNSYTLQTDPSKGRLALIATDTTKANIITDDFRLSSLTKDAKQMSRSQSISTGRMKFYHNLGRKPSLITCESAVFDNSEGAGNSVHRCTGAATSATSEASITVKDTTGYATSSITNSANIIYLDESVVGNLLVVDDFTITINFTTFADAQMDGDPQFIFSFS